MTPVTCSGCGLENLKWVWNFSTKRPFLVQIGVGRHICPSPRHARDIFPGWCTVCKAPELSWVRKKEGFELMESYGLPHTCEQNVVVYDMSEGKCRACKTSGLIWVQHDGNYGKYSLLHPDGTKHTCLEYTVIQKDWAEAKRMDYAFEKAWINSIADDSKCKKCKGSGHKTFQSRNKRLMAKYGSSEPISVYRPCRYCRCLGIFSVVKKKFYLSMLRKKYWPFRSDVHKWKKYNKEF
jgi:hypothetical protein